MSRTKLQQGHRVRYSANGRRMRGEVVDPRPPGGCCRAAAARDQAHSLA